VHAAAGERIQVRGQRGDEGLAFPGLHLGDDASVEDDPAQHLDVVVALSEGALRSLAHGREGLGQQIIEGLAAFEALAERPGPCPEVRVRQPHDLGLPLVGALHQRDDRLQDPIVVRSDDLANGIEHGQRGGLRGGGACRASVLKPPRSGKPVSLLRIREPASGRVEPAGVSRRCS
jgi:hypothetical protein